MISIWRSIVSLHERTNHCLVLYCRYTAVKHSAHALHWESEAISSRWHRKSSRRGPESLMAWWCSEKAEVCVDEQASSESRDSSTQWQKKLVCADRKQEEKCIHLWLSVHALARPDEDFEVWRSCWKRGHRRIARSKAAAVSLLPCFLRLLPLRVPVPQCILRGPSSRELRRAGWGTARKERRCRLLSCRVDKKCQ